MNILESASILVFTALNAVFDFFRATFFYIGIDIIAFLLTCFGLLCVYKLLSNTSGIYLPLGVGSHRSFNEHKDNISSKHNDVDD